MYLEIARRNTACAVEHRGVFDATLSRNGRYLATASTNGTTAIWDVATGKMAAPNLTHPGWVFSVVFSADGRLLLTACRDHMVRVWDWQRACVAFPAMEHEDEVFDAGFSSDRGERWILTVGRDSTLRIWDWRLGRPAAPARKLSGWAGYQLLLTPDARHAVVGGCMSATNIFDLHHLNDDPELDADGFCVLAEILSGRQIQGSGTVNLTSAEWLERWGRFRQGRREYLGFRWPDIAPSGGTFSPGTRGQ